jgi:hypothetical protein
MRRFKVTGYGSLRNGPEMEMEYFPVDNARVIYRKIFQCLPRMFIFYEI